MTISRSVVSFMPEFKINDLKYTLFIHSTSEWTGNTENDCPSVDDIAESVTILSLLFSFKDEIFCFPDVFESIEYFRTLARSVVLRGTPDEGGDNEVSSVDESGFRCELELAASFERLGKGDSTFPVFILFLDGGNKSKK